MEGKKVESRFVYEEDEIDIFEYLTRAVSYWKRIVFVTLVAGIGSYYYFSSNITMPIFKMQVEMGFDKIKVGEYPDGSVFKKNDLISNTILEGAYEKLEKAGMNGLSIESFKNSFLVEPVYPVDIQTVKDLLGSDVGKLQPHEIVTYYEKVRGYIPSVYIIEFTPPGKLPPNIVKSTFEEIIDGFTANVQERRLPNLDISKSIANIHLETSSLPLIHDNLSASLARLKRITEGPIRNSPGLFSYVLKFRNTILEDEIHESLAVLELIIFDSMSIGDVERYKMSQGVVMNTLGSKIAMLEEQVKFRMELAELPMKTSKNIGRKMLESFGASTAKRPVEKSFGNLNFAGGGVSLVEVLLTYNSKYYSLMDQETRLFDEKLEVKNRLVEIKRKLARINQAGSHVEKGDLIKKAESMADSILSRLKTVAGELDNAVYDYFLKYEPPVKKYVVIRGYSKTPYKKVIIATFVSFLAVVIFQLVLISYAMWKEEKEKTDRVRV